MSYIENKDKNQILESLMDTAQVGSQVHEQLKAAINVRCTEDIEFSLKSLENQIKENAESSTRLAKRVFWLNVVLAVATFVGAVATIIIAMKT